jgi:hypothetical protein
LPDDELTEVGDDFTLDEDAELEAAEVDVLAEVEVEVDALALVDWVDEVEAPGIV